MLYLSWRNVEICTVFLFEKASYYFGETTELHCGYAAVCLMALLTESVKTSCTKWKNLKSDGLQNVQWTVNSFPLELTINAY